MTGRPPSSLPSSPAFTSEQRQSQEALALFSGPSLRHRSKGVPTQKESAGTRMLFNGATPHTPPTSPSVTTINYYYYSTRSRLHHCPAPHPLLPSPVDSTMLPGASRRGGGRTEDPHDPAETWASSFTPSVLRSPPYLWPRPLRPSRVPRTCLCSSCFTVRGTRGEKLWRLQRRRRRDVCFLFLSSNHGFLCVIEIRECVFKGLYFAP